MTPDDVVDRIVALWPAAFPKPESLRAWRGEYQAALRPFSGARLAKGWAECMAGRTVSAFPKPGEVAECCKKFGTEPKGDGINMRKLMEHQQSRIPQMLQHWKLGHPELVQAAHDDGLDFSLDYELRRLAITEAQREFVAESRGNEYHWKLDFGPEQLEELRQRRASQEALAGKTTSAKPFRKLFPDKFDQERRQANAAVGRTPDGEEVVL